MLSRRHFLGWPTVVLALLLAAGALAVLGVAPATAHHRSTHSGGPAPAPSPSPSPSPTAEPTAEPSPTPTTEPTTQPVTGTYDELVLSHTPALYVANGTDLTGRGHTVSNHGGQATVLPNGEHAYAFDGLSQYVEVADADDLSAVTTGILTVEAWVRPDVLDNPTVHPDQYVHWLGKGVTGQHEYAARLYNKSGTDRPNRTSGYAWNLSGGLGAGSYFQDALTAGQWMHYGFVIDTVNLGSDGWGTTRIYRDGVLRDTDTLGGDYNIVPANGTAPLRIGTRDLATYLQGAIGKVAVYGYDASAHFPQHVTAMTG